MLKKSLIVLVSIVLLFLASCGQKETQVTSHEGELEKVSLMLDWYPNAVHSFLFTAQKKGYFEELGIEVDIQMPAETNDPLRLVAAGKVDIALSYQPQVLVARSENIPVKSFAAIVRHPLNHLMVPKESPIFSPKDLVGKTVGYPSIPLNEVMLETMLKSVGEDKEKVEMVDVGWDLIPALATNKTDAMLGGFINHEKLMLENEGHSMRTLNPVDYGVPDYYELVMVSSDEKLLAEPELFEKFMTAIRDGQKYVNENPEEGLAILLEQEDQTSPLEKDIEAKSLEILLPLMEDGDQGFGSQDLEAWSTVADWLKEYQVIQSSVKPEDAFVHF
jgi:putative hydroxymethylpyrimidine transport system substrate-binding protein